MSFFTQPSVGGHSAMPQAKIETIVVPVGEDFGLGWQDQVLESETVKVYDEDSGRYVHHLRLTILRRPN